jgi:hypothetical protein
MTSFTLPALPAACEWRNSPPNWKTRGEDNLAITAGGKTDWLIDPARGSVAFKKPAALSAPPDARCFLSAKVSVSFASTFNAGVFSPRRARTSGWRSVSRIRLREGP